MVTMPRARVVCHPDPLRLEHELAARIRAHKNLDPWAPILVTAPSQRMVLRLREILPMLLGALLGVEVLNYQALAYRMLENRGRPAPALLSRAALEVLFAQVLSRHPGLGLSRYAAGRPGAVSDLVARIEELREAGIQPADLEAVAANDVDRELASIYAAVESALGALDARGWTDRAGLARRAAASAPGTGRDPRPPFREVFAYGAYELVGMHLDLLESLRPDEGVTFLVPGDLSAPAWRYARDVVHRHFGKPQQLADPLEGARPFVSAARAVYDPRSQPAPLPPGALRFTHAQGPEGELTVAVRRVLSLLADGVPPSDIAIVARSLDPYLALAETVFARHGLDVDSSGSLPLSRYPAPRSLLLFLRLLRNDFDRRSVIELARSRHLLRPAWTEGEPERWRPHAWDRWSRAFGIVGGLESWTTHLPRLLRNRTLPRWMRGDDEETAAFLARNERESASAEILGRLVAAWAGLRDRWSECRSARDHADLLRQVTREWIRVDSAAAEHPAADRALEAAWEATLSQLAVLECPEVSGNAPLTRETVIEFVVRSLEETRMPLGTGRGISFLDAMQARGLVFRHVLTLGFNDHLVPRSPRENPLLPDAIRRALRSRTGRPLAVRSEGREEERLLLAQGIAAVVDRWTVSWQRADADGKALSVSLALRELARLLPRAPSLRDVIRGTGGIVPDRLPTDPAALARWLAAETGLLTREEAALLAAQGHRDPAAGLRSFAGDLDPELGRRLDPSCALIEAIDGREGVSLAYDGALPGGVGWRRPHSATTLEQLARCPLTFFFQRILGVHPLDDELEAARVPAKEIGEAVHSLLERIYTDLARQGVLDGGTESSTLVAAGLRALDAHWDEALAPASERLAARYPILHRELRNQWRSELEAFLRKDLERLARERHRFEATEAELAAELALECAGGGEPARADRLLIRGILDRMTLDPSGRALLVDYKTSGNLENQVSLLAGLRGEHLQVPLYLLLAETRLGPGSADAEVLGVGPAFLPDDGYARTEPPRLPGSDLGGVRDGFLDTLAVLGGLPDAGRFPFRAGDHCRWCGFRPACRRRHLESHLRVETHPDHRVYFALQKKTRKHVFASALAENAALAYDPDDDGENA